MVRNAPTSVHMVQALPKMVFQRLAFSLQSKTSVG